MIGRVFTNKMTLIRLVAALVGLAGCGLPTHQQSQIGVTQVRKALNGEHPSVVKILRREPTQEPVTCTGTFIAPGIILTAAHCGGEHQVPELEISWENSQGEILTAKPNNFIRHPMYTDKVAIHSNDLAIIVINEPDKNTTLPAPLLGRAPTRGNLVTIVGYGDDHIEIKDGDIQSSGSGPKRIGHNSIYTVAPSGIVILNGSAIECENLSNTSVTGNGDSGGPLFIDGSLAAVTLGGGILNETNLQECPQAVSYFAGVFLKTNWDFIKKFIDL